MSTMAITQLASGSDIPAGSYSGYVRMSDEPLCRLIDGDFDCREQCVTGANPFVVEGNLYDADQDITVAIRHTGDCCLITLVNWQQLSPEACDDTETYLGIGFATDKQPRLRFVRLWQAQPDPLCAGMPVMTCVATAFRGFATISEIEP